MKLVTSIVFILLVFIVPGRSQKNSIADKKPKEQNPSYWNSKKLLNPLRLPFTDNVEAIEYIDLDNDGDPDVLKTIINNFPVLWIDDDDDMKDGDLEGDIDSDCLMVDRDKNGEYAAYSDVVVDWVDNDGDNIADMQIYAEYADEDKKDAPWGPGHLMINMDLDKDNILNYIDWNNFNLRGWIHDGQADFYEDYIGQSLFLKIHTSPEKMNDPRLNWENPFLFYDPDNDGLTEYAIRVIDNPVRGKSGDQFLTRLTSRVSWVSMSFDLDNDNSPGNEFDFDMTINFKGEKGFDYMDQIHPFPKMRGLPESDQYFMDPRVRQMAELIYPDHDAIHDLVFKAGEWEQVFFVFDEDDDCARWERVELLDPLDPYITGRRKGGLDNNPQCDVVGDRGEWDMDNSGNGNLYISRFDGRIHLFGAETGYWRIDQNAWYYQGMGGLYDSYGPGRLSFDVENQFPVIKYSDTDNNGFIDQIEYDLDGDKIFEEFVSLKELSIDDVCPVVKTESLNYDGLVGLEEKLAEDMWQQALLAVEVASQSGLEVKWYALLMHPKSIRQKYHLGYWLQFYLYRDLLDHATIKNDKSRMQNITKAYYNSDWKSILKGK